MDDRLKKQLKPQIAPPTNLSKNYCTCGRSMAYKDRTCDLVCSGCDKWSSFCKCVPLSQLAN